MGPETWTCIAKLQELSVSAAPVLLEAAGLSKAYGRVTVLDDVSVQFRSGEIHALLGENGAGKSTLVKILAESHRADDRRSSWTGASERRRGNDIP